MTATPFHEGEQAAQSLAGVRTNGGAIRDYMPDQHRTFFEALPCLFAGVLDRNGWPVATMLTGAPGFIRSPDPVTLTIDAAIDQHDPAAEGFALGCEIGILGLDLATRRRNRANGRIAKIDANGFTVAVRQSFGNCPQYIQSRTVYKATAAPEAAELLTSIDAHARAIITTADTFFVASRSRGINGPADGCDISHRGGKPGFIRIEGDTLVIPDFRGNRYFNTLGNLLGEPRASLLFLDFQNGDLLQLQGMAEIDWSGNAAEQVQGAERMWRFHLTRGWRRRAACPLRWSHAEFSPATEKTGIWCGH